MTKTLRPYQREAIDALYAQWGQGGRSRLAVLLPTGMGKTVILANLIKRERERSPGKKVVILSHRDELVTQAKEKVEDWNPGLNVGIVKANRNEIDADVISASVQTLRSEKRRKAIENVGLIIIDECHHAVASSYMETVKFYGGFDGRCRVAGFTATLERNDDLGLGDIWEEVVYRKDIAYAIDNKFLVQPRTEKVRLQKLDLSSVAKVIGGDYSATDLGKAMHDAGAPKALAEAYIEHAGARQGVVFCPTVSLAREVCEAFNSAGIVAEVISGETPSGEREEIYAATRRGDVQVLVNVMVLTEGFDMPQLEVCVVARPTESRALYIQMVGRVLRLHPGKHEALVLDVVGASVGMDLKSAADLSVTEEEPVKSEVEGVPVGKVSYRLKKSSWRLVGTQIRIVRYDSNGEHEIGAVQRMSSKGAEVAARELTFNDERRIKVAQLRG